MHHRINYAPLPTSLDHSYACMYSSQGVKAQNLGFLLCPIEMGNKEPYCSGLLYVVLTVSRNCGIQCYANWANCPAHDSM